MNDVEEFLYFAYRNKSLRAFNKNTACFHCLLMLRIHSEIKPDVLWRKRK